MPDLLAEQQLGNSWSAFVISVAGFTHTAGRAIFILYVERAERFSRLTLFLHVSSLILSGAVASSWPWAVRANYAVAVVLGAFYGLFTAIFMSLKTILLVELLGMDRLTNAFGFLLLVQGLGQVCGPPIAGFLWDFCTGTSVEFPSNVPLPFMVPIRNIAEYFKVTSTCSTDAFILRREVLKKLLLQSSFWLAPACSQLAS
ncbi:hypothetical protein Ciccas_013317 [Cichlidogyrus casuarinus]|uniref:Uncharacterized protein n=1 Tax=Cichlidogyrus casuarinus TaxID=1844966 RepID=A0ABD2PNY0_9PLAT